MLDIVTKAGQYKRAHQNCTFNACSASDRRVTRSLSTTEETDKEAALAKAQQLRLKRMLWGFASQSVSSLIVIGLCIFDLLSLQPALIYFVAILFIDLAFVLMLKSGINLRFSDPSMTAAQIIAPLWPAIYAMYFVSDPQARTAFLMTAITGLLFGSFALSRSGMLKVGSLILVSYLVLLTALDVSAPERLNWQVEVIIVFTYAMVLLTVAYLASFIANMRLSLKEKNRQLAELALRDPLTQLPNRRSLMEQLGQEVARVERRTPEQNHLCISMLDVDHFKRINDTWGHDAGDAILCQISDALRKIMRQGDFLGRFGGEEFVIILPESTLEAAQLTAKRIQECVAALEFAELPPGAKITVSQGLAVYRANERIEATIKRADDALYAAKKAGRNQVVVGEPLG